MCAFMRGQLAEALQLRAIVCLLRMHRRHVFAPLCICKRKKELGTGIYGNDVLCVSVSHRAGILRSCTAHSRRIDFEKEQHVRRGTLL